MDVALGLADRVTVLHRGRVILEGTPDEVRANPEVRDVYLRPWLKRSELSVRGIHTYYGDSYVLQGLDLEVREGTIVAILGRNGMGKTTLIRSVAGLTPPRQGEILFKGEPLRGRARTRSRRLGIALVPQGRRIFRSLSVRENLLLPTSGLARPRAGRWTLAAVLAEFPQLAERIDHAGAALSGGEQQMLAIGRALMANPELILMDEPSEGLSPKLVQQVGEIMRSLRAHGTRCCS